MKRVIIYTDGACSGNPGPGGWGAILTYGDVKKEVSGGVKETTNNVMEIMAIIESLKLLKYPCEVEIHSDSAYVVNTFEKDWLEKWKKNGWRNSKKEEVKNKELWEELDILCQTHKVKFVKVKGHSDNEFNNLADKLAKDAIKTLTNAKK